MNPTVQHTFTPANIRYLVALRQLSGDRGGVRCTDLARRLNVAKPSVHTMVHSLCQMELVTKERYGMIYLTDAGRAAAARYAGSLQPLCRRLRQALELDESACENAAYLLLAQIPELAPDLPPEEVPQSLN